LGAELLNFTLGCWCIGVITSTAAAITTTTAAAITSTAASYVWIAFICVFGRALAPFAFFIFSGHRSYFCNVFVGGFGFRRLLLNVNLGNFLNEPTRKPIRPLSAQEKSAQTGSFFAEASTSFIAGVHPHYWREDLPDSGFEIGRQQPWPLDR
jgi:hypothetical protein